MNKRYTWVYASVGKIKRILWFHGQVHVCLLTVITLAIFARLRKIRLNEKGHGVDLDLDYAGWPQTWKIWKTWKAQGI